MNDIDSEQHIDEIRGWIAEHIEADLDIVDRHQALDGYLGRATWGGSLPRPLIQIASHITTADIGNYLLALALRGHICGHAELTEHANELESSDSSLLVLQHLVLHEVAHALHEWPQALETECDVWVYNIMTSIKPSSAGD
jgi:hypothetical protein